MKETQTDIIIIGAGAAGLMAAKELSQRGKRVIILEARDRIGGRISSFEKDDIPHTVEKGAEFIHGNLPVTMNLVKEARMEIYESGGQSYNSDVNGIKSQNYFIKDWDLLMDCLMKQKKDISIAQFLNDNFSEDKFQELRNSVSKFVEGYDAADTYFANIFALRNEWSEDQELIQYRLKNGYGKLISHLEKVCIDNEVKIYLSSPVDTVKWEKNTVEIISSQRIINASKIIITVPIGVLRLLPQSGGINFIPAIPNKIAAAHAIGFGSVIKFLVSFKESFWEDYIDKNGNTIKLNELGFLFSEAEVPTWWSQFPNQSTLLTGWLAGPKAEQKKDTNRMELEEMAINSISQIFHLTTTEIKQRITSIDVINWASEIYTRGAYAYSTIETPAARMELIRPEEETVYFAGEALYDGAAMGTVEAALSSGLQVAKQLLIA